MSIRTFIFLSLILHGLIFSCVYLFQPEKKVEKKDEEYFASLVTPEVQKPQFIPVPPPVMKSRPPVQRHTRQMPSSSRQPVDRGASRPFMPLQPKALPHQENSTTRGEGGGTGKLVPDEIHPLLEPEETGKAGEGFPKKGSLKPGFSERGKFLFDKEVTEKIAGREFAKADKGERNHPITFDTKIYEYSGYMAKLRQKIESIWQFPPEAVSRGIKFPQDLKIQFTIKKDGTLAEVRLIRTSGYKILDDAALKALRDGEPYWPLPEEWGKNTYTILGHFIYGIYGYELR